MPFKDPEKKREYQRQWKARRRQEWLDAFGPCAWCGGDEELQIDHVDRATKTYNPTDVWSRKLEVRHRELLKCQVLCEPCHSLKTLREMREDNKDPWDKPKPKDSQLSLGI